MAGSLSVWYKGSCEESSVGMFIGAGVCVLTAVEEGETVSGAGDLAGLHEVINNSKMMNRLKSISVNT
jgi:hypothetical protein